MHRLASYPYVMVRIACSRCPRRGRYRLARLAERFGADADLGQVMAAVSADCPLRAPAAHNSIPPCGIHMPDLASGRPPDLPGAGAVRLLAGGRRV